MQYKVCGITDLAQAIALDEMKVNFIGFIFYPSSKRYVLNNLSLTDLQDFKTTKAKKVGVFVNEPLESLLSIVKAADLDMVQLHGDEDLAYCTKLNGIVSVVKVFRVGALVPNMDGFDQVTDYFLFDTENISAPPHPRALVE